MLCPAAICSNQSLVSFLSQSGRNLIGRSLRIRKQLIEAPREAGCPGAWRILTDCS
jgi:hypothetical protein